MKNFTFIKNILFYGISIFLLTSVLYSCSSSQQAYNEGDGIYGTPDQKITMTSFPYDWMEASFFYTNIQGKPYCEVLWDPVCQQDYKDKGFNLKLKLMEQDGKFPSIAIGLNDFAGTGLYSSEYLVGSYGFKKTEIFCNYGTHMIYDIRYTILEI